MSSGETPGASPRDGRVRQVFEIAIAMDQARRKALIASVRETEPDICAEVEDLLAFHDTGDAVLDDGAMNAAARMAPLAAPNPVTNPAAPTPADPRLAPFHIAGYEIVREIGHGGMGVVYEARQEFPARRVALKIVRPELVSPGLVRRFTHEAETLAMLHHPGIAQLYEAGFADHLRSRPFMAMELVEGRPLHTHCLTSAVSTADKLALMIRICDAVDHAHRRGVVHRDLKPANILVDAAGQPKVLDFGIARLTATDSGHTAATSIGQLVGTLGYMSPEQLSGDSTRIDSRCDVFALGVVMYELLAGRPPVDVSGLSVAEATVALREREPLPLGRLDASLRGDLEAIVAKAMERDPAHRYQSAAELAGDIRRHLEDEPVTARALTAWYQAGKFARRHKGFVAAAAAVLFVLTGGVVAFAREASLAELRATEAHDNFVRAEQASHLAEKRAAEATDNLVRAKQASDFLERMIETATPEVTQGKQVTIREMLDSASRDLLASGRGMHPLATADAHRSMGKAYGSLGEYQIAIDHYAKALEAYLTAQGPDGEDTLRIKAALAIGHIYLNQFDQADAILDPALKLAADKYGPEHPITLRLRSASAFCYGERPNRDADLAYERHLAVWELSKKVHGPASEETLREQTNLGVQALESKRLDEGQRLLQDCVDRRVETLGADHPDTLLSMHNLVAIADKRGDLKAARSMCKEVYERSERVLGPTHPVVILRLRNYAMLIARNGDFAGAETYARTLLERRTARYGPVHEDTFEAEGLLFNCLIAAKKLDDAQVHCDHLYTTALNYFSKDSQEHMQVLSVKYDMAQARGDRKAQREWAEKLRGTSIEKECFRQLAEDEENDRKAAEAAKAGK